MDSPQTGITNQTSGVMNEDNLSHWITSKASEEITRIKNHEVQQNEHDDSISVIAKPSRNHNRITSIHQNINLRVNSLPENWNPGCTESINKWFDKIGN